MPLRPTRSVFQCVAVWCNVVQCVVVCCSVLQYVADKKSACVCIVAALERDSSRFLRVLPTVCYRVLRCVAV